MHGMDFQEEMTRERRRSYVAEADERRLALEARKARSSFRSRVARRLFEVAMLTERDATWNAVWEKMKAPKHS